MVNVFKVVNWFRVRNNAEMRKKDFVEELTQMKAMKLLYYAQGVYLAVYNKPLFDDDIVAWKYGPAIQAVHNKYIGKRAITGTISDSDIADYEELQNDAPVAGVLSAVESAYGDMSASELVKQTHTETPWKVTNQSGVISTDVIRSFFKENIVADD